MTVFNRLRLSFTCAPSNLGHLFRDYSGRKEKTDEVRGAPYLSDALDGILAQTFQDFEVVAVNDGSTDDTALILDDYARMDVRVRVVHQENRGIAAARNTAIKLARGRFIALHDGDDLSLPQRLEKQTTFLDSHPEVCAVFCRTVKTDEHLNPLAASIAPAGHRALRKALMRRNVLHANFTARAEVLKRIGGYREAFFGSEDYDLNLRLAETGQIACVPEVLHVYRTHRRQFTREHGDKIALLGALARVFACERRLRGEDSYAEFEKTRDVMRFAEKYSFRSRFFLIAGARSLRAMDAPAARKYLRRALRESRSKALPALLYAFSLLPQKARTALATLRARLLVRRWTDRIPGDVLEFLAARPQAVAKTALT